ncbi:O-acetyl-ADP-ribose deacetylase (regulator of RNase III), contains Macro domain [Halorientalis persicus]|uniref:O-acetyl-ADP-ribose deacetylase (Regulator of RNase III), contains Macro domain n=1 Tax=Halorientalis persicus TaxID=1367881 RepID=A0A1H8MMC7_9EURY|nr:macro domain-containing protein [Halorientalis persicus]SEO18467.1 O-acetyl-ADP-ribose deacetylase (regulator of RNase III), contains Macro domain [Halorientalis persicus]
MDFCVLQGDIAQQEADTLVNAAGTSLKMGSGVAGTLLDAANGPLERDAVACGPVELGTVVTDAYDLDADYVIHAAAMSHSGPHPIATAKSLREATQNSLETADELGCESLVLPLLGCGSGGFHTNEGASLICDEIWAYEPTTLEHVRVIAYSNRERDIIRQLVSDQQHPETVD